VLKHLVGYLRLHPDIPFTFNRATNVKDISANNFELLEPDLEAQVSSAFIQMAPPAHNVPHESDPEGFTSWDNLHQSMDVKLQVNEVPKIGEVHRIAPPVTECLVDAKQQYSMRLGLRTTVQIFSQSRYHYQGS
jgi:hypothetical protein